MQLASRTHTAVVLSYAGNTYVPARRITCRSRRACVVVRADDDDILPIISGRIREPAPPENLPKPKLMGGKTIGEELGMLHKAMQQSEEDMANRMEKRLYTDEWQGDVYVGSNWNIMTFLAIVTFLVPLLGLLVAWLSYGTLWTGNYYGAF